MLFRLYMHRDIHLNQWQRARLPGRERQRPEAHQTTRLSANSAGYNPAMGKQVIHVTQAEALSDFAAVLKHIRAGVEVIIEENSHAIAVLSPPPPRAGRMLSEAIASAESRGSTATLDGTFARDLAEIISSHREPLNPPRWE